tara:strand:- start:603 stop:1001 length:399 start_codon:yes stop_codon:yes gene_type:complete
MGILSYGYKAIKSIKPKTKMSKTTKVVKEGQADVSKIVTKRSKENPRIKEQIKEEGIKTKAGMTKSLLEYNRKRKGMMGGGMMGRPMYKKGSKKAVGKKSDFGMLSVKAGIDNNPNPTQADRIAGAKMKKKK